jgi:hypothetical protein
MKLLHISGSHARNVEFIVRACKLFNNTSRYQSYKARQNYKNSNR